MSGPQGAEDPIAAVLAWQAAGRACALATVVETWGSAPRPVGSQLAISAGAELVGSVSGGCVEGAVVAEALEIIGTDGLRLLEFGVSDDEAFAVGLACGGRIRVAVASATGADGTISEALQAVGRARAAGQPIAYVLDLDTGADSTATPAQSPERFRLDRSGLEADGRHLVCIHNAPLRMVIVGAVHIAQALVPMAQTAGYAVTVIDPREAFATPARFPGTALDTEWPDTALAALAPDARTAVVTLTHDPKIDDPAISAALRSDAFYIGCLGSTRTHAKRTLRLTEQGWSARDLARLHGPVGLDIGSRTPGEIAVSILAEVTQSLRRA